MLKVNNIFSYMANLQFSCARHKWFDGWCMMLMCVFLSFTSCPLASLLCPLPLQQLHIILIARMIPTTLSSLKIEVVYFVRSFIFTKANSLKIYHCLLTLVTPYHGFHSGGNGALIASFAMYNKSLSFTESNPSTSQYSFISVTTV